MRLVTKGKEPKKSKHPNYFHHGGFFMMPLVASTFGHCLHPHFCCFLWNFALRLVDHNNPALFDLYRTGEVRHAIGMAGK